MSGNGTVLIVGAGDDIGAAVARRFAKGGYTVCAARRTAEKLEGLISSIKNDGGSAYGFPLDARKEDQVKATFRTIEKDIGPLDCVIFNPGANVKYPIRQTSTKVFQKVWELCCFAGFLCGREAADYMVPRGRGSIFFTGATASMRGGSGYAAFSSGKFGLRALAQSMARELGPENIHVAHLVIDAGVDTKFVRALWEERGIDLKGAPEDTLMDPQSIGEAYYHLHHQSRDAWTFEMDLRPYGETW
ncbi:MAG: SDR family oxidoreductase [Pseudomonadota bacterium]